MILRQQNVQIAWLLGALHDPGPLSSLLESSFLASGSESLPYLKLDHNDFFRWWR